MESLKEGREVAENKRAKCRETEHGSRGAMEQGRWAHRQRGRGHLHPQVTRGQGKFPLDMWENPLPVGVEQPQVMV